MILQPGDKLKCIDGYIDGGSQSPNPPNNFLPIQSESYTAFECSRDFQRIRLVEDPTRFWWSVSRFQPCDANTPKAIFTTSCICVASPARNCSVHGQGVPT